VIPARVVLATANPGKVRELRELVGEWGAIDICSLADFPDVTLPEETGTTYVSNASAKAHTVARVTRLPALADDSGLEVDALAGAPGVRSARFAPTDSARIERLLAAMEGLADRRARFRCAVVLAWPDGREDAAEGVVEGRIALTAEGRGGFGYDPVFVADEIGVTFAAAAVADKARVSHRARAVRALGEALGVRTLRGPGGPC